MATITGGADSERLVGTASSDVITGREGDDVFVLTRSGTAQTDVITDFGTQYFGGRIDAAQEVPTNASTAVGQFSGALRPGGGAFDFRSVVTGLDFGGMQTVSTTDNVQGGHFHVGPFNVNGSIVYGFIGNPASETEGETVVAGATGTVTGQWDAGEGNATTLTAQLAELRAGNVYINYHTGAFPGGEVRGQVLPLDFGRDRVDVSALGIGDFATVQALLSDVAGSARLTTRLGGQVTAMEFQNLRVADLTAADFIFSTAITNDQIEGTTGDDDLFGGPGNDLLVGGDGADRLFGGLGLDTLSGGAGGDLLSGGDGNDQIGGGAGADSIDGGAGDDFVGGEADDDRISGGAGVDVLFGDAGNDLIGGGLGADRLFGQDGDDFMGGESDNDFLDGGLGVDVLFGDAGDDTILGGAENDRLFGGDGADTLIGQAGDDFVDGGAGVDTAVFGGARAGYTITTVGGVTTITGRDGTDRLLAVERLQFDDGLVTLSSAPGAGADEMAPLPTAAMEAPMPADFVM